jgi:hypothetical protein
MKFDQSFVAHLTDNLYANCAICQELLFFKAALREWDGRELIHPPGVPMKDLYQVLQQKEADIVRIRKEIESLHIVAPLLECDGLPLKDVYAVLQEKDTELARIRRETESLHIVAPLLSNESPSDDLNEPSSATERLAPTGTGGPFSSMSAAPRAKFWKILRRKT